MSKLTVADVLEVLSFDPETGLFEWLPGQRRSHIAGRKITRLNQYGYITLHLKGRNYVAHRLAWFVTYGEWPNGTIDHIDRDKTNNRPSNLRVATNSQNCRNKGLMATNSSGFKGVSWNHLRQKWQVFIGLGGGKNKNLGTFTDINEAARAYAEAAKQLYGEFAHVPEEQL